MKAVSPVFSSTSQTPPVALPLRKQHQVPIEQMAGWAPELAWTSEEQLNLFFCQDSNPGLSSL